MDKKENIIDADLEEEELDDMPEVEEDEEADTGIEGTVADDEEDCEDEVDMALKAFEYDEDGIEVKHIRHDKKRIIPNKEKYKRQYLQDEWRARDFYERYGK